MISSSAYLGHRRLDRRTLLGATMGVAAGAGWRRSSAWAQDDAVSDQFVENGLVVLFPSLAKIGAFAWLCFKEIEAGIGQGSRRRKVILTGNQVARQVVVNLAHVGDFAEARGEGGGRLRTFL